MLAAGNSINLVQLTKRANKLGYHTYVGKGMVLVCAAADTKGKLSESACETVSTANFHSAMTAIIAYQPSTAQAATLGIHVIAKVTVHLLHCIHTEGTSTRDVCSCLQVWLCCHLQWQGARERGAQALSGILH